MSFIFIRIDDVAVFRLAAGQRAQQTIQIVPHVAQRDLEPFPNVFHCKGSFLSGGAAACASGCIIAGFRGFVKRGRRFLFSADAEPPKANAARVVMTESAFFASAAQKECYGNLNVEQYEVVGTFDNRMCDYCGAMDGKVFPLKDFKEGSTAPPFHPWCRCTTAPYFEDMKDVGERWARDIENGKGYFVPSDMTYEEWKATQDAKYGEGAVDNARKKAYNKTKTNAESAVIKLEKKIEEIRAEILEGKHNLTINQGNQDKHIVSSHSYKEELHKSIFYGDQTKAQEMVNEYHGTGKIKLTSKGEWAKKEFISVNEDVGAVFDAESQEYVKTKRCAIHYGKNGTHIVPVKGE